MEIKTCNKAPEATSKDPATQEESMACKLLSQVHPYLQL